MINANTYEADISFPLVSIKKSIGKDADGLDVELSLTLKQDFTEYARETITHEKTHAHTEISISVWVGGNSARAYGGQSIEVLRTMKSSKLTDKELGELADIWERWHLNDLKAGCEHQESIPTNAENYGELADAQNAKCTAGYEYGSAWLIEVLPYSVIKFCVELERKLK